MGELAQVAYGPYVSRIGREPEPMTADYAAVIRHEEDWVVEQSEAPSSDPKQGGLAGPMVPDDGAHC